MKHNIKIILTDDHRIFRDAKIEYARYCHYGYHHAKNIRYRSIKTVDAHKNHIMQKLKLKNIAELVIYAIKNKIIEV